MKSVDYFVRRKGWRSDGTTPIYIKYNYDRDNRPVFNTGKIVHNKYWDFDKNRLKRSNPDYAETFQFIDSMKKKLEKIIDQAMIKEIEPTPDYVKLNFESKILNRNNGRTEGRKKAGA